MCDSASPPSCSPTGHPWLWAPLSPAQQSRAWRGRVPPQPTVQQSVLGRPGKHTSIQGHGCGCCRLEAQMRPPLRSGGVCAWSGPRGAHPRKRLNSGVRRPRLGGRGAWLESGSPGSPAPSVCWGAALPPRGLAWARLRGRGVAAACAPVPQSCSAVVSFRRAGHRCGGVQPQSPPPQHPGPRLAVCRGRVGDICLRCFPDC